MAAPQPKSLVEQAQDELVCSICTDFLVKPRSLSCLHSFCEECLTQLWRVSGEPSTLTCPECRAKTSISAEGIAGGWYSGFHQHRYSRIYSILSMAAKIHFSASQLPEIYISL